MAFFSFSLLQEHFIYLSTKIEPNKKYYSKDIALSKELNNKNKLTSFAKLNYETRVNVTNVGKINISIHHKGHCIPRFLLSCFICNIVNKFFIIWLSRE